jgi:hypothetical protein
VQNKNLVIANIRSCCISKLLSSRSVRLTFSPRLLHDCVGLVYCAVQFIEGRTVIRSNRNTLCWSFTDHQIRSGMATRHRCDRESKNGDSYMCNDVPSVVIAIKKYAISTALVVFMYIGITTTIKHLPRCKKPYDLLCVLQFTRQTTCCRCINRCGNKDTRQESVSILKLRRYFINRPC